MLQAFSENVGLRADPTGDMVRTLQLMTGQHEDSTSYTVIRCTSDRKFCHYCPEFYFCTCLA